MKVAIVGGGFTGLAAAYTLTKKGHEVAVFEKSSKLGGLAAGFQQKNWDWPLECTYHHCFTNDQSILKLINELGLEKKLIIKRPITANLYGDTTYQLDSPFSLFQFPLLPFSDKVRTAVLLGFLKINPFWQPLENITAEHLLTSIGGKRAYQILWEPLLIGKFGNFASKIQAAWFWARIQKRTPRLVYIEGGFQTLIDALAKQSGKILLNKKIESLKELSGFDKILLTNPQPSTIPHLWAQTLILETKKPILKDVYWLNVTDRSFPFLAAVAHTNFMPSKQYGGHHLTYFGNYLPDGHKYLSMNKEALLKEFLPFIKRLNPNLKSEILNLKSYLFTAPHAQPVHELHYSSRAPKLETNIPNVYLANMDSIYPWDRGTNYAVELGKKAAEKIMNS